MPDFTDGGVFLDFFGSFWSRFYGDPGLTEGIANGDAHQIAQIYQEFVEAINALSLDTIAPFHREIVYPIVLRRSAFSQGPDFVTFGGGQVFGEQPAGTKFREGATFTYGGLERRSGLYYIGVPDRVKNLGRSIFNSLIDPTVALTRDNDFLFEGDTIVFKADPFENPLIPKRLVAGSTGDSDEEEIVLWAVNVDIERNELYRQYGFAVSNIRTSSANYKEALRAVFHAYASGPTTHVLDSLVATLGGLPIARRGNEVIQAVESFGEDRLVITDLEVYKVPTSLTLRPEIQAGTKLYPGQPLTTATEVFDRTTNSNWWTTIPNLIIGRDYLMADLQSALGFLNQSAKVELGEAETTDAGVTGRPASFYLAGLPQDVETFWKGVTKTGRERGEFLGDLLYKKFKLTDDNGDADFTQELHINPLELLATDLLGDSVVLIRARITDFDQTNPFFQNLRMLREIMPAYLGLIIFVDVSIEDTYSFQRETGGSEITSLELSDTAAILRGDVDSFEAGTKAAWQAMDAAGVPLTKTPEALSVDLSPDTIATTLDMGTAANNAAAYGGSIAVCEETVQGKLEEICTP